MFKSDDKEDYVKEIYGPEGGFTTERRSVWFQRNLFVVAKKMGKLEKEAYLEINKADLRLGTNTGSSSATPRDWVTSPAPLGSLWADQFDACQLQFQRPAQP